MRFLRRYIPWIGVGVLFFLMAMPGLGAAVLGSDISMASIPDSAASAQAQECKLLSSPLEIPSPGLIHFDDLPNAAVIEDHYKASHGVVFENTPRVNRAIIYGNEPNEAQSRPNVAINDAVFPVTSSGIPMRIEFDEGKSHVGFWIGNGETAEIDARVTAFNAEGQVVCEFRQGPVPEPHSQFVGLNDPESSIRLVLLDYGETLLSESIDDLYFYPYKPPEDPRPTPTRTPVPTWTPMPSPTPPPDPTPTPLVYAGPIFAIQEPILTNPAFLKPDLSIFGIEITQGVQCFDNTKGLASCGDNNLRVVNKKDTAARIYLKYSGVFASANNVPVRLHIRANGVWYTANASGKATTILDQSKPDSAEVYFNVNFTNDVVVDFYAEVDPDNVISETNETNNRWPSSGYLTRTFRKRGNLKVVGQRLWYHPSGYSGDQFAGGWAVNGGGGDFLEQMLPIRDNGVNYSIKSGYLSWTKNLSNSDNQHDLIKYLNLRWLMENTFAWLFGSGAFTDADHVYGWAPNDGYSGGHADMPVYPHAGGLGVVGIGTDRPGTSTDDPGGGALIMAHELLHDYDLKHTDTGADDCGSNDSSSNFPYATSSIQEFGYNPYTGKIYDPADTHDVLSYCPAGGSKEGWVSPYTWEYMNTEFDVPLAGGTAEINPLPLPEGFNPRVRLGTQNLQPTADEKSLLVDVTIYNPDHKDYNPDMPAMVNDLHLVETGLAYPLPDGDYELQLRRGDTILHTEAFSITFISEYTPGVGSHAGSDPETPAHPEDDDPPFPPDPNDQADAVFVIPWVEYANQVLVLHKGKVLAQKDVSLDPPEVTITSPTQAVEWPAGTTQEITWTGSDPNGDSLSYTVFFSHDAGLTWQLMETGLTDTSYSVEVDSLAGGNDVRFRVVVTDGVLTNHDETPEPITVPNKAPLVTLFEPINGKVFLPGSLVVLKGSATDLEDGGLPDESLFWTSDRQGSLGTGPSIPINSLDSGDHEITLTAYDSLGEQTSQSVVIFVGYPNHLPIINR